MRMIYALRMRGTDIISRLRSKYIMRRKPYIILRQQYFIYEAEPPPRMRRGLVILVDVIRIGLAEQCDAVDQPADAKEAAGKEVQDAHTNFTLIELVGTKCTQEEAEQECYPFVFGTKCDNGAIDIGIFVGVGIGGDFEYCAYLSKKALCREENHNSNEFYKQLEIDILEEEIRETPHNWLWTHKRWK